MSKVVFEDWGLIDYRQALDRQLQYVEEVAVHQRSDTIVFCSHPPIVTLGRATQSGDITTWSGDTLEVSRGGRATYHGPSQLVIYPILNLLNPRGNRPAKDIGGLLRDFEAVIVKVLFDLGIKNATGKTYKSKETKELEDTGVWVGLQKVASLGLAVRKWTSFHGAALNIEYDPQAFCGMKPCGYPSEIMTSIEEIIGVKPDWEFIKLRLKLRYLKYHLHKCS
jgi:lipoate-protein ligase B